MIEVDLGKTKTFLSGNYRCNTVKFHFMCYLLSDLKQIKAAYHFESEYDILYALHATQKLSKDKQERISWRMIIPALFFALRFLVPG